MPFVLTRVHEFRCQLDSIQGVARLDKSFDQQALRAKTVDWLLDRRIGIYTGRNVDRDESGCLF